MVRRVRMKDGFARVPYREAPICYIYLCGTGAPCFTVPAARAMTSIVKLVFFRALRLVKLPINVLTLPQYDWEDDPQDIDSLGIIRTCTCGIIADLASPTCRF